ncbi:SDR family NAD(P)-dependent oxidoreductase [Kineococcus sp. SYSU DK002]|uniref:SDR family NAD(P)-dependent oxidoreductase n=1 Tax=Kineococcus sp. SYSU DK002 TaxID=3383123 RepID=UPI003D7D029C
METRLPALLRGTPRRPLHDGVVLVTGAARGIGLATARALHARGARLALLDSDGATVQARAAELGPRALAVVADVTERSSVDAAVAHVVAEFGRIDVVFANAGIAPLPATVRAMDDSVFDRVLDVDLRGVHVTVQAALEHVIAVRGQIVINSSTYAFVNGVLVAPYAVAKAALEQYGRVLRVELAQHRVDVSLVYLGFVETAMERATFGDPVARRLLATHPSWVARRLDPDTAGTGIAAGIERRAPRIVLPRTWVALGPVFRVLGPLMDRRAVHDEATQAVMRAADVPVRARGHLDHAAGDGRARGGGVAARPGEGTSPPPVEPSRSR